MAPARPTASVILLAICVARMATSQTCGDVKVGYQNATLKHASEGTGCCGRPDHTPVRPAVDLSGVGICRDTTITASADQAWVWQLYPAPVFKRRATVADFSQFVGRNSIVWSDSSDLVAFRVVSVKFDEHDIDVVHVETSSRLLPLHLDGKACHFTLDSVSDPDTVTVQQIRNVFDDAGVKDMPTLAAKCGGFLESLDGEYMHNIRNWTWPGYSLADFWETLEITTRLTRNGEADGMWLGDNLQQGVLLVASMLGNFLQESSTMGSCDELCWTQHAGQAACKDAPCGQYGNDYDDPDKYQGGDHDCPANLSMTIPANTPSIPETVPPSCGPNDEGGARKGCCWWGRGPLQLTGRKNYGDFGHWMEVNKQVLGDLRSPICKDPGSLCNAGEKTAKNASVVWLSSLSYWLRIVQPLEGFRDSLQTFTKTNFNTTTNMFKSKTATELAYNEPPSFTAGVGGAINQGHWNNCAHNSLDRICSALRILRLVGYMHDDPCSGGPSCGVQTGTVQASHCPTATNDSVRCGTSWADAEIKSGALCAGNDTDCPQSEKCYTGLTPLSEKTCGVKKATDPSVRCGLSWKHANGKNGDLCTGLDADCPQDEKCFHGLTPLSRTCGVDYASSLCGAPCPKGWDSECPSGQRCWTRGPEEVRCPAFCMTETMSATARGYIEQAESGGNVWAGRRSFTHWPIIDGSYQQQILLAESGQGCSTNADCAGAEELHPSSSASGKATVCQPMPPSIFGVALRFCGSDYASALDACETGQRQLPDKSGYLYSTDIMCPGGTSAECDSGSICYNVQSSTANPYRCAPQQRWCGPSSRYSMKQMIDTARPCWGNNYYNAECGEDESCYAVSNSPFGYWNFGELGLDGRLECVRGFYAKTWLVNGLVSAPPADTTMHICFSGLANPGLAKKECETQLAMGANWLSIGGNNEAGAITYDVLEAVIEAVIYGEFDSYSGILIDIEYVKGNVGDAFLRLTKSLERASLGAAATTSHTGPFHCVDGCDGAELVRTMAADINLDVLSPQLYSTGNEESPDFAATWGCLGCTWDLFRDARPRIAPSIVHSSQYVETKRHFKEELNITISGYIQWAPRDNFPQPLDGLGCPKATV